MDLVRHDKLWVLLSESSYVVFQLSKTVVGTWSKGKVGEVSHEWKFSNLNSLMLKSSSRNCCLD